MNDTERVLGELTEFKRATLHELALIRDKVEALNAYKWKVTGIMAAVVFLLEIAGQYVRMNHG